MSVIKKNKNNINILGFRKIVHSLLDSTNLYGRSIWLMVFVLMILKQFVVYYVYWANLLDTNIFNTIFNYLWFFASDFVVFGTVIFLVFLNMTLNKKILKPIINIVNFFLVLLFSVDIIVMSYFQSRLSIIDIYGFVWSSSNSYFIRYVFIGLLIFFLILFLCFVLTQKHFKRIKDKNKQFRFSIIFFFFSVIFFIINYYSYDYADMQKNIFNLNFWVLKNAVVWSSYESWFVSDIKESYEDYFGEIRWKDKKMNIIVVFAESFSAIDSFRVGWTYNNLPLFDKLQSYGMTFTNFLANGCTSETAHIAMLKWVEPRETPMANGDQAYNQYASYTQALPSFFNQQWYNTIFLSTVTLDFLDQKSFLSWVGFQTILWDELFKKEKKYVFDAAPDHILYNKAIQLVEQNKSSNKPYFLTLQTISSHKPYDTPYGESKEKMFEYVDKSIYAFYMKLKKDHFFDNWILVIVWDHKKMEPVVRPEYDKYWLSASSRSLATVIWRWIKPWTINSNYIQHTDFFYSLKYLVWSGNVVVSSLFNNVFSNNSNRDWAVRCCRFAEWNYFVMNKDGLNYKLLSGKNQFVWNYVQAYKNFQYKELVGLTWTNDSFFNKKENSDQTTWGKIDSGVVLIWHAGSLAQTIGNSLEWMLLAKKNWANGVEMDFSLTKDDQSVNIHGPSLQSTFCGIDKKTSDYDLAYLKKNCKLLNGEEVLTMEEMLQKIKWLFDYYFIEIKVYDKNKAEKQILDAINVVQKLWMQDKVIFISYDRTVNYIMGSYKWIRWWWDSYYASDLEFISNFPHEFFLVNKDSMEYDTANYINSLWKKFVVYTIDTTGDFQRVYDMWARMMMVNDIPLIKNYIKTKN